MPYTDIADLPAEIKRVLPNRAQAIFVGAFNTAWEGTCKDREDKEACCNAIAWTAVKQGFKKLPNGNWIRIQQAEMELFFSSGGLTRCEKQDEEKGVLFKKELISVGNFIHPQREGERLDITYERMLNWVENFHRYINNGGKIPVPLRHTDEPEKNTGWLKDMEIEGKIKLFGLLRILDEKIIPMCDDGRIADVSVRIVSDTKDEKGNIYDEMINHVALTPIPHIRGQGAFIRLENKYVSLENANELEDKDVISLIREDWNRDKFSNKPWGDVDKTQLPVSAYLVTPDKEHRSTWKIPYRDGSGKINIGAVIAIYQVLQGAHGTGLDVTADVRAEISGKVEGWRKELGLEKTTQEEEMKLEEEIKALKEKLKKMTDDKDVLEKKIKDSAGSELETLKTDLEALDKINKDLTARVEKSEERQVKRDKAIVTERVDKLIAEGKLEPVKAEKVKVLLEADWSKPIELEEKKGDEVVKRSVSYTELMLEIFEALPVREEFEEKTVTKVEKDAEDVELEKKAKEHVKTTYGSTKSGDAKDKE